MSRADHRSIALTLLGLLAPPMVCGACGNERPAPPAATPVMAPTNAQLGGKVVARVGEVELERSLVRAVMTARRLDAKTALDALIEEAILAEAAVRAGAPAAIGMRARLEAPLSRLMLDRLRTEALAQGDWTDDEIALLSAEQWQELDRPDGRTVVHALVKKEVPDAEQVAKRLRDVLLAANGSDTASSAKAFTDAARAFKIQPPVHVEELSFVGDGRMLEGKGVLLPSFTKGAFAIPALFATSEVVETSYGFHVIRLLAIYPPKVASRAERVARLGPQLVAQRVKLVHDAKIASLAKATSIQMLAADQDLALPR